MAQGGDLTRRATAGVAQAASLAPRTLQRLRELSSRVPEAAPTPRATQRLAEVGPGAIPVATKWLEDRRFGGLGDEFEQLAGIADIDLNYNDETRIVTFSPDLGSLAELGRRARARAAEFVANPPYVELESIGRATAAIFSKLAELHDYQVRYLSRLTPDAFDDGSWRQPATEFQANYQRQIDAVTEPGPAWFAANAALMAAVEAAAAGGPRR